LLPVNFAIAQNAPTEGAHEFHVGVILDLGSMVGKIARTSISLAMEGFYAVHKNYSTKIVLHVRDSMSDDVQAASEGTCSELLSSVHCIGLFFYAGKMH
jgi:ionotropic glutamate receptor